MATSGKAASRKSDNPELVKAQKKIKKLEGLLAIELERAAELLKENTKLESNLEETRKQRDCWQKLYREINPDKKIDCNRQNALIVRGEIDMSEVLGQEK